VRQLRWWGDDANVAAAAVSQGRWEGVRMLRIAGVPVRGETLHQLVIGIASTPAELGLAIACCQAELKRLQRETALWQLTRTPKELQDRRARVMAPHLATMMSALRAVIELHEAYPDDSVVDALIGDCLYRGPMASHVNDLLCYGASGAVPSGLLTQLPWASATHGPALVDAVFAGDAFAPTTDNRAGMQQLLTVVCERAHTSSLQPRSTQLVTRLDDLFLPARAMRLVGELLNRLDTDEGLLGVAVETDAFASAIKMQTSAARDERNAATVLLRHFPDHPGVLKCGICGESGALEPAIEPAGGEHYRKKLCGHKFCADCLAGWIGAKVTEGVTAIQCPAEGCCAALYPDDVERMGRREDHERYRALHARQGGERLRELASESPALRSWFQQNTRACPSCSVLIERSQGCNSMLCPCGSRFNWTDRQVQVDAALAVAEAAPRAGSV
jgi:hypothetical protein